MKNKNLHPLPPRVVLKRNVSINTLPRTRGPLLNQIKDWLAEAPRDEVLQLPGRLREPPFRSISEELDKLLCEIELQNPGCSLTV